MTWNYNNKLSQRNLEIRGKERGKQWRKAYQKFYLGMPKGRSKMKE